MFTPSNRRRLRAAVAGLAMALAGLAVALPVAPASAATSGPPWPSAPSWQSYDKTPASASVCPTAVTSTSGSVSGAAGLLCGGSGGATLTMTSGGAAPVIVLDYGKIVAGIPYFTVSAASGSPTLRAGYSQSARYVSATGDSATVAAGPVGDGDTQRYDDYTVTGPGTITNQFTQGGERYEEITLTSPGSVTLSGLGISYIADRTQASGLGGYFVSSNDQLNQIWYASEYTDQLDSVPYQSLPGLMTVTGGALQVTGTTTASGAALLNTGTSWGNYTVSFQAQVVDNQAGWIVRGQDAGDGYVFILNDSTDTGGTPNQLQEFNVSGGGYNSLGSVALPSPLQAGTWHTVSTTVSGSTITVSLDGTRLTSLTDATHAAGTVGFREYRGEQADFKNLTVTSSIGTTLFSDPLSSSLVLSDFPGEGTNQHASVLDGATRDRLIWSGDLNVEIPGIAYSTGNNGYAKGALRLLGSYQLTSGFVTGALSPHDLLAPARPSGSTGLYSASYSIYYVLDLADYYLYSGDTAFVSSELPVVQDELAWDASQLDSNGLLNTNGSDNLDWDYYDGGKSGEVTAYNLLYYKALLDGAMLASAAGDSTDAAAYTSEAAALKSAINARLYDSSTGLYRLSDSDTTVAQDANSLAVLYGVAPASDDATILAALKSDLWTTPYGPLPFGSGSYHSYVSPFASGYELDARLAAGDTGDAESLLSTEWGHMIAPGPDNAGTMWEVVDGSTGQPGFGSFTSLAHGWATTPVSALSGYVLGVQPDAGGFATWTVQPHPGDLAWAEGAVPTPHGAISVQWGGESGAGEFAMAVTAPSGTSGTIAVPTDGAASPVVAVNGSTVWSNGTFHSALGITGAYSDGAYVYLTGVPSGTYYIGLNPGNYGPPAGYTQCASENGTCAVSGTQSVAFGANGIYSFTTESAATACNTATLGDPDYGIAKTCYTGPVPPSGPPGVSAAYCAHENDLCAFTGTHTVYFGAGSNWASKTVNGGTPCTNTVFGDPDYGVVKACFVTS